MKSKKIVIPLEEDHHAEILAYVKKMRFDSVAAYIRMLIRQDMGQKEMSREEHF